MKELKLAGYNFFGVHELLWCELVLFQLNSWPAAPPPQLYSQQEYEC